MIRQSYLLPSHEDTTKHLTLADLKYFKYLFRVQLMNSSRLIQDSFSRIIQASINVNLPHGVPIREMPDGLND